jgi:LytR cell envelope-related transcriptional attenuator
MAELRTPGERSQEKPPFDPPRGDEGLDDWFARRLESQGIKARRARIPFARILAVVALAAALIALVFVLNAASGHSTAAPATHPVTHKTGPTGTTAQTTPAKARKPLWQRVKLTILNGFGGTNAAGSAKVELQRAGWTVIGVGDASPVTQSTIVVYVPGFLNQAKVVATRLGLPAPVPIAQAQGVVSTQTDSVAIVLGHNLLPNGAG